MSERDILQHLSPADLAQQLLEEERHKAELDARRLALELEVQRSEQRTGELRVALASRAVMKQVTVELVAVQESALATASNGHALVDLTEPAHKPGSNGYGIIGVEDPPTNGHASAIEASTEPEAALAVDRLTEELAEEASAALAEQPPATQEPKVESDKAAATYLNGIVLYEKPLRAANHSAMLRHGDNARVVKLRDGITLDISGNPTPLSKPTRAEYIEERAKILGALINTRGRELKASEIRRIIGREKSPITSVMRALAGQLVDASGQSIVRIRDVNARLSLYSLKDDVVIVDERSSSSTELGAQEEKDAKEASPPTDTAATVTAVGSTALEAATKEAAPVKQPRIQVINDSPAQLRRSMIMVANAAELGAARQQHLKQAGLDPSYLRLNFDRTIEIEGAELRLSDRQMELLNHLIKNLGTPLDAEGLYYSGYDQSENPLPDQKIPYGKLAQVKEKAEQVLRSLMKQLPGVFTYDSVSFSNIQILDTVILQFDPNLAPAGKK